MKTTPKCPDCDNDMEAGFIPDFSYGEQRHTILKILWHPGNPERDTLLGFQTGGVKVEQSAARNIVTYRCPDCGLLRSYAE